MAHGPVRARPHHAGTLVLIALVIIVFDTATSKGKDLAFAGPKCAVTAAFIAGALFANDEVSKLPTLYAILPLSRRRVVLSRYVELGGTALLAALAGLGLTLSTRGIVDTASRLPLTTSVAATGLAFAVVCAVISVQTPLLFALGHARAGMYSTLATVTLVLGGTWLSLQSSWLNRDGAGLLASKWTGPVGLAVGVVVLAASAALSLRLYQRRDL